MNGLQRGVGSYLRRTGFILRQHRWVSSRAEISTHGHKNQGWPHDTFTGQPVIGICDTCS
jgi:hypothetical protein